MQQAAKIKLSKRELHFVHDHSVILTKTAIIQKVYELFGDQLILIKKTLEQHQEYWPVDLLRGVPKIARGENYHGLPYVMMDYPARFHKSDTLALRTFFWWGNFFSVTLHLTGEYKAQYGEAIMKNVLAQKFHYCISEKQWSHQFEKDNYVKATKKNAASIQAHFEQNDFMKIAIKIPLKKWNKMPELLSNVYEKMLMLTKP